MNDQLLDQPQTTQEPESYYEALVGEGRKFADNESLAKGKWTSDSYVKVMETRQDEMRDRILELQKELTTRTNLEDLVNNIKSQTTSNASPPVKVETEQSKPFDPKQMETLIASKVKEYDSLKKQEENFNLVKAKIKERYGDNVPDSVRQQIEALGDLGSDLARKAPEAFLKTLGFSDQPREASFQAPPNRATRSDNFQPKGSEQRTWSYYQKLKEKNPNIYYDRKTAVQMHNDAIALGEAFNDGDFQLTDAQLLSKL